MPAAEAARLVGLWEQAGTLHPSTGVAVPWPDGSLNASVREFFRFFSYGTFHFGRFLRDAEVSFDDRNRAFVCVGHTDKVLRGCWRLENGLLIQEFWDADQSPEVRAVDLAEVGNDRFIVNEKTPLPGLVLPVVYRKVPCSEAEPASVPAQEHVPQAAPPPDPAQMQADEPRPWWKFWARPARPPMDPARRELVDVLRTARALLARPGNDFAWSAWADAGAALRELDRHIAAIEAGSLPARSDLNVLFAPTGPIQEVSLSSGWGAECLDTSRRFALAVQPVYS